MLLGSFEEEKKKLLPKHTEFQGVILAGYGNRFSVYFLTARLNVVTEDDNLPKALLPIANRPMIFYVIEWLESAGVHGIFSALTVDIVVVSQGAAASRISHAIRSSYEPINKETEIDVAVLLDCLGSVDALRQIKDRIKVHCNSDSRVILFWQAVT